MKIFPLIKVSQKYNVYYLLFSSALSIAICNVLSQVFSDYIDSTISRTIRSDDTSDNSISTESIESDEIPGMSLATSRSILFVISFFAAMLTFGFLQLFIGLK